MSNDVGYWLLLISVLLLSITVLSITLDENSNKEETEQHYKPNPMMEQLGRWVSIYHENPLLFLSKWWFWVLLIVIGFTTSRSFIYDWDFSKLIPKRQSKSINNEATE